MEDTVLREILFRGADMILKHSITVQGIARLQERDTETSTLTAKEKTLEKIHICYTWSERARLIHENVSVIPIRGANVCFSS